MRYELKDVPPVHHPAKCMKCGKFQGEKLSHVCVGGLPDFCKCPREMAASTSYFKVKVDP